MLSSQGCSNCLPACYTACLPTDYDMQIWDNEIDINVHLLREILTRLVKGQPPSLLHSSYNCLVCMRVPTPIMYCDSTPHAHSDTNKLYVNIDRAAIQPWVRVRLEYSTRSNFHFNMFPRMTTQSRSIRPAPWLEHSARLSTKSVQFHALMMQLPLILADQ